MKRRSAVHRSGQFLLLIHSDEVVGRCLTCLSGLFMFRINWVSTSNKTTTAGKSTRSSTKFTPCAHPTVFVRSFTFPRSHPGRVNTRLWKGTTVVQARIILQLPDSESSFKARTRHAKQRLLSSMRPGKTRYKSASVYTCPFATRLASAFHSLRFVEPGHTQNR